MSKESRKPPADTHPWKRPAVPQKKSQLDKLSSAEKSKIDAKADKVLKGKKKK
jgi:hypothetical protein